MKNFTVIFVFRQVLVEMDAFANNSKLEMPQAHINFVNG